MTVYSQFKKVAAVVLLATGVGLALPAAAIDLDQARTIMARHGAMQSAQAEALSWAAKARAALVGLPDHPLRAMLDDLATYVVARIS